MQNKFKKIMILALLGLMLASAAVPVVSAQPLKAPAAKQESVTFAVSPNAYFAGILDTTASIAPTNTTFFAPFVYNETSFNVSGKFMSFMFYSGLGSIGLTSVRVNQSPIANVSRMLYSYYTIPSAGAFLDAGVAGSIFYAYTNTTLLIAHNNPEGLIQVFTYRSNVTVQAVLSVGLQPNSKFTMTQTEPTLTNGTVAMMFNDTDLAGYFVSGGSNFSSQLVPGSNYYSIIKQVPEDSYLDSFSIPNGESPYATVLSAVAQAMSHNTISYYAAVTLADGQASVDAAYFNNALRVERMSVASGDINMQFSKLQSGVPDMVVLLLSGDVFNGTASRLVVDVNGQRVMNVSSLPSILNPFGNTTRQNTTTAGSYTIVTVYSPTTISSLHIYTVAPQPANSLTVLAPFAGALAVIVAASVLLFRRKNTGGD